jgi:hypothetical protein
MTRKFINMDANESIFFERELLKVKAKSYDIKYPALKARTLIPVSFEAGSAAESIKYEQYSQVGIAKIIANYGKDLPRADIVGKEFTANIKSLGASYGYSLQEIRAAQFAGKPLQQRKANAAKRAIAVLENSIAWEGDATANLGGFISNENVSEVIIPADGTGSSKTLASKTADKILRDLASLFTQVHTVTKGIEVADTLLLPLSQYNYIYNTRIEDTNLTVAKFFLENNPHCKAIEWLDELDGAGVGGVDRMYAYKRHPDNLTLEIPSDFEQLPVQEDGLEYEVPCHERIGGVIIYYPLSIAFADGI